LVQDASGKQLKRLDQEEVFRDINAMIATSNSKKLSTISIYTREGLPLETTDFR